MKVIFLDIDGCLNNQVMYERKENTMLGNIGGVLDKLCIANLNNITDRTGAKIVISSTWRLDDACVDYLKQSGVTGEIIGATPWLDGKYYVRGNEILAWIQQNQGYGNFNSYAIIDDFDDMLYSQRNNFFWCDPYSGLTPELSNKIINFLNQFLD